MCCIFAAKGTTIGGARIAGGGGTSVGRPWCAYSDDSDDSDARVDRLSVDANEGEVVRLEDDLEVVEEDPDVCSDCSDCSDGGEDEGYASTGTGGVKERWRRLHVNSSV